MAASNQREGVPAASVARMGGWRRVAGTWLKTAPASHQSIYCTILVHQSGPRSRARARRGTSLHGSVPDMMCFIISCVACRHQNQLILVSQGTYDYQLLTLDAREATSTPSTMTNARLHVCPSATGRTSRGWIGVQIVPTIPLFFTALGNFA